MSGFVNSDEFDTLCNSYGISRGILRKDGSAINPGIGQFAERLYTKILERDSEKTGKEYWMSQIADGLATPEAAAKSFFYSQEYLDKKSSNTQYVETLYRTFMGREADEAGLAYWVNQIKNGMSREQALDSMTACPEFQQIKQSYGL